MIKIKLLNVFFLLLIGTGVFSCKGNKQDVVHIPEETRTKYNFNLDWKIQKMLKN